jgi:adenosylhomocysteine nucleosidase
MKRVLICAAIPRELKYIERIFPSVNMERSAAGRVFSLKTGSIEVTLSETGIGVHSAESSIQSLLNGLHPDLLLSLGFGGAIYGGLTAGDLVWASRVLLLGSSHSMKERAEISEIPLSGSKKVADGLPHGLSVRQGCIVTLRHPMTKPDIRNNLPPGISFPVCDMETFVLADAATQRHIPFFAVRSISDTADQEVPREFLDITGVSGQIAYRRLVMSLLQRPVLVKDLLRLGMNSEKAAKSLGDLVKSFLDTAFMNE